MIPALISAVKAMGSYAMTHPDLVVKLAKEIEALFGDGDVKDVHPEAVRAMVSGLAAARANAVQEAKRRDERRKSER